MLRALAATMLLLTAPAWAVQAQGWEDSFDGGALDARWTWRTPAAGPVWSLAARPGWLRISVPQREQGFNHWNQPEVDEAPQLRAAAPAGDWELEARIELQQYDAWSHFQAGLVVGQSDRMLLTWGPLQGPNIPGGPKTPEVWLEPTGTSGYAKVPGEAKDVTLRITKVGNTYAARVRNGQGDWVDGGTYPMGQPPRFVGLIVKTFANTPGITVDVDYVRLTPAGGPPQPVPPQPETPPVPPVPPQPETPPQPPVPPVPAPGQPPKGFVVWESNRTGAWELYRADPDGTGLRRLTWLEGATRTCLRPRVSPDGQSVLFACAAAGRPVGAWVVPADGGEPRELAAGLPLGWIDGGRAIALIRGGQVWRHAVDGGGETLLSPARLPIDGRGADAVADIRPDLKWVAFETPAGCECFSLEQGKAIRKMPGGRAPRFSADGAYVYWVAGPREFRLWNIADDWEQQILAPAAADVQGDIDCPTAAGGAGWLAYSVTVPEGAGNVDVFLRPLVDWQGEAPAIRVSTDAGVDRWPCLWVAR